MVKVAIAGANSGLALELIDELTRDQKHQVLALCRKDPSDFPKTPGVEWVQTTFQDKAELAKLFKGVEVVLSFIVTNNDPGNVSANNLLDAAIEAGVKRFAPSEWAMSQNLPKIIDVVPWYQGKLDMQARLREVNKDKKVIEYTLFQPGMFMEYAGYPKQISTHVPPMPTVWAVDAARVSTVEGHEDDLVTITTVGDIVRVVRRAIEYEGEWPVVGGIAGHQLTAREFKDIVERVTGKTVKMTSISQADLKAGNLTIEMPPIVHPSIPEEQRAAWHGPGWIGILTAVASGAWKATEEWNDLLPDFKFTSFEDFVRNNWGSK